MAVVVCAPVSLLDQRPQLGAKHTLDQPAELAASELEIRIHTFTEILCKYVEGSERYAAARHTW